MERIVHLKLNQSKPPNQNLKNENTLGKEPNDHPIANHSTNYNLLTKISPIPNSDTNKFQLIGNFTRHSTNELVQGNLRVQPSIDPTFHQNDHFKRLSSTSLYPTKHSQTTTKYV